MRKKSTWDKTSPLAMREIGDFPTNTRHTHATRHVVLVPTYPTAIHQWYGHGDKNRTFI